MFERADVTAGIVEGVAGAGIEEASHAATHQVHPQQPFIQIHLIEIGDSSHHAPKASPGGRDPQRSRREIPSRHGITALGLCGFFLRAQHPALGIELRHPITLRIADGWANTVAPGLPLLFTSWGTKSCPWKRLSPGQGLRGGPPGNRHQSKTLKPSGLGCTAYSSICPSGSYPAAAQMPPVVGVVMISTTDPGQHQGAEGVINHRLVVNRQQLFADGLGDRMQPCSTSASQDDSPSFDAVLIGWMTGAISAPLQHASAALITQLVPSLERTLLEKFDWSSIRILGGQSFRHKRRRQEPFQQWVQDAVPPARGRASAHGHLLEGCG